jgi:hypothetical protein
MDQHASKRSRGWRARNITDNAVEVKSVAQRLGIVPRGNSFSAESFAPLCARILPQP